ncbi:MAG: hypothetical protein ACLQPI_12075 [Limisphaerales bacterium]
MGRSLYIWVAAGVAFAIAASAAQAQTHAWRPRHHFVHAAYRPGDIVVHARRSYLDPGPGTWTEIGTSNRYVTDTTPESYVNLGMPFSAQMSGF